MLVVDLVKLTRKGPGLRRVKGIVERGMPLEAEAAGKETMRGNPGETTQALAGCRRSVYNAGMRGLNRVNRCGGFDGCGLRGCGNAYLRSCRRQRQTDSEDAEDYSQARPRWIELQPVSPTCPKSSHYERRTPWWRRACKRVDRGSPFSGTPFVPATPSCPVGRLPPYGWCDNRSLNSETDLQRFGGTVEYVTAISSGEVKPPCRTLTL